MLIKNKKEYNNQVKLIKSIDFSNLSDTELRNKSFDLKTQIMQDTGNESTFIEAYALVNECMKRVLKIRPYESQILAGIAMNGGNVVEMNTGEGKTFAAVFTAYFNALKGKGMHVLTFNDYLAKRDALWVGPVYEALGLSVGYVTSGMSVKERKEAYSCDITYVTAKEAGFDYLRDMLCYDEMDLVHRPFHFALVDEADSILIDEARIPLVIAGISEDLTEINYNLAEVIRGLTLSIDYDTDENDRNVYLTETGVEKIETIFKIDNLYDMKYIDLLTSINCALHAEALLKRDIHYIVRDHKVELIDELTGRVAENRHWPDGLQEALEAKEGLTPQGKGKILGTITIQSYLSLYPKLAGMTATAASAEDEFDVNYKLDVFVVKPTFKCIREDLEDLVFPSKELKYKAVIDEVVKFNGIGRPILIGTSSVEESEHLAALLEQTNIKCNVLNAKNDEIEAQIIAKAGEKYYVTVSTNMAGRGVDIKLGGGDEKQQKEIAKLGGLYLISINKNESIRIDNQLKGRSGRQGDPGTTRFFLSLEDDLFIRFGINRILKKYRLDHIEKTINSKTSHIQRVIEGQNYDIRQNINKYAFLLEQQRRIIAQKRNEVLLDHNFESFSLNTEITDQMKTAIGSSECQRVVKRVLLFYIDEEWCDYLEYVSYVREGIHLISLSKEDPLHYYHVSLIEAFDEIVNNIEDKSNKKLNEILTSADYNIDLMIDLKGPSATWTYIVNDNEFLNRVKTAKRTQEVTTFVSFKFIFTWPIEKCKGLFKSIKNNR